MQLSEVVEALEADVLIGDDALDEIVPAAAAADMVSDLLSFSHPGMLILTGLTNPSIMRASQAASACAIVFVRGKKPEQETIDLAQEMKLPLMTTPHSMYDSCGRLYVRGLPGVIPAEIRINPTRPGF